MISFRYGIKKKKTSQKRDQVCGYQGQRTGLEERKLEKVIKVQETYARQKATGRTGHGTTDWFQIGKGVHQGCILSAGLFNYMQSTS